MVLQEEAKLQILKKVLEKELGAGETCLVFAGMKLTCDTLKHELHKMEGLWCKAIHSNKEQWDRDAALKEFRERAARPKYGEKAVLVATDVASRGLDIPGVSLVVVYDFGKALHSANNGGVEAYVHRIGRTGRAGKTGKAVTFFTSEDCGALELIELLKSAEQHVPNELVDLAEDESYARWEKKRKNQRFRPGGSKGKGKGKGSGRGFGRG